MDRRGATRAMFALTAACCVAIAGVTPSVGLVSAAQGTEAGDVPHAFDIPAQPLSQALSAFDARAGLSVFFPSDLVAGRMSSPVAGTYHSAAALDLLLAGTGLVARRVAASAFVLAAVKPDGQVRQNVLKGRAFDALVQRSVQQALCAQAGLAPGSFRLAMVLHIEASGRVSAARLLDTTGQPARDTRILRALEMLEMGRGPVDPGRPYVVLIRERPAASGDSCAGF